MTERTRHPACCPRCQGRGSVIRMADPDPLPPVGYRDFSSLPVRVAWRAEEVPCDHTFSTGVTDMTEDEMKIDFLERLVTKQAERAVDLERRLAECAASREEEARKAADAALERAAKLCDAEEQRQAPHEDAGEVVAANLAEAIRALKGSP